MYNYSHASTYINKILTPKEETGAKFFTERDKKFLNNLPSWLAGIQYC
jgi:hypothetical protein